MRSEVVDGGAQIIFDPKEAIAGTAGAVCNVYWGHPFDTLKVRLQAGTMPAQLNMFAAGWEMVRTGGTRGLYQGATPALGSALVEYSVLFTVSDAVRRQTASALGYDRAADLPLFWQAVAGGIAGIFSGAAIGPPDLLKVRLQAAQTGQAARTGAVRGPLHAIARIFREEGALGLFRGTPCTIAREPPFNFVLFGAYEAANTAMVMCGVTERAGPSLCAVASGGIAGVCAWAATLPIDYVKSVVSTSKQVVSPWAVFTEVVRTRGLRHLYIGFGAVSVRAFMGNAGVFWGYEQTKRLLSCFQT